MCCAVILWTAKAEVEVACDAKRGIRRPPLKLPPLSSQRGDNAILLLPRARARIERWLAYVCVPRDHNSEHQEVSTVRIDHRGDASVRISDLDLRLEG